MLVPKRWREPLGGRLRCIISNQLHQIQRVTEHSSSIESFIMKITDLKTYVVANLPPHRGGPYFVFLKLTTDDNLHGFGEVYGVPFQPGKVTQLIEDVVERNVIGQEPFNIEKLWRIVYSRGYTQHPDLTLVGVLSGIEIACWDLIGKALNQPVYNLLGGQVHEKLRSYTYLYAVSDVPPPSDTVHDRRIPVNLHSDPALAAERAVDYVEQGFTAVKFDPHLGNVRL